MTNTKQITPENELFNQWKELHSLPRDALPYREWIRRRDEIHDKICKLEKRMRK